MAYKALHRFARMSPTKIRPIADMIRKKPVEEAMHMLGALPNRGARMLEKVLSSAIANAQEQGARNAEEMVIVKAMIDEGPRMKRIKPRARGSAYPILKRLSHIRLEIDNV